MTFHRPICFQGRAIQALLFLFALTLCSACAGPRVSLDDTFATSDVVEIDAPPRQTTAAAYIWMSRHLSPGDVKRVPGIDGYLVSEFTLRGFECGLDLASFTVYWEVTARNASYVFRQRVTGVRTGMTNHVGVGRSSETAPGKCAAKAKTKLLSLQRDMHRFIKRRAVF